MKQSLGRNRALMLRAALETVRGSSSTLIELLDLIISDSPSEEIDKKVEALGGGDADLLTVLDNAFETATQERNCYIQEHDLAIGEASFKVKEWRND